MNTARSCFATIVAFLVVAIDGLAVDAVVCCNSSSVASGGGDFVASCQNKNRTFHTIEAFGGGTCNDNLAAVPIRKCCPLGLYPYGLYDICRPSGADGGEQMRRMMQLLREKSRVVADAVMVGYNYEGLLCGGPNELIYLNAYDIYLEALANDGFPDDYCFDLDSSNELVALVCRRSQYCLYNTCVPRCCKGDRMMVDGPNGPECTVYEKPFRMFAYLTNGGGTPVYQSKYIRLPSKALSNKKVEPYYAEFKCSHRDMLEYGFQLTEHGDLYLTYEDHLVLQSKYCVGYSQGIVTDTIVAYICDADTVFMDKRARASSIHLFYRASYVASAVCLALTLLVYNILPSLRNNRNYYVKCYMSHLFVSYICVIAQINMENKQGHTCFQFGYITLFVFLSTLCWLNVICFDIYWKIRYNISRNRNTSTSVRSIMYHFYSWGLPSTIVYTGYHLLVFTHYVSQQELAPYFQIPGDGCFYYHMIGYGRLIFFLIPMCIMLTVNLIFFLLTAIQCSRIKSEINNFNPTDSKTESFLANKEIFVMSIKLFLIMEFPYLPSILSFSLEREETNWYIMHVASSLQGVLIFIVFVAKRKVIMDLRKKFRDLMDDSEPTQMNNISGSS